MHLEGFFGFSLELVEGARYVQGHGIGALSFEIGELGGIAGCGYDFVAAGESFSSQSRTEARRAASDEPNFACHVESEVPEAEKFEAPVLKKNAAGEC